MLLRQGALKCRYAEGIAFTQPEDAVRCLAKPGRVRQHGLEHGLQFTRRAADHLEHIGSGGLLLQRLAQLVEQAGVLDGDDRLRGKVLDQLNLLIRERPNLLTVNHDSADQLVFLEHRHEQHGPYAGEVDQGEDARVALNVAALRL
jgi:hypothetical protein